MTALTAALVLLGVVSAEESIHELHLSEVQHHAVLALELPPLVVVPLPWDAYRIAQDEAQEWCLTMPTESCYFAPGVTAEAAYFAVGRGMRAAGHKLLWESPLLQRWGLHPVGDWHAFEAEVRFTDFYANGTLIIVRER